MIKDNFKKERIETISKIHCILNIDCLECPLYKDDVTGRDRALNKHCNGCFSYEELQRLGENLNDISRRSRKASNKPIKGSAIAVPENKEKRAETIKERLDRDITIAGFKRLRKKGMSYSDLAKMFQVSEGYLSNYMRSRGYNEKTIRRKQDGMLGMKELDEVFTMEEFNKLREQKFKLDTIARGLNTSMSTLTKWVAAKKGKAYYQKR